MGVGLLQWLEFCEYLGVMHPHMCHTPTCALGHMPTCGYMRAYAPCRHMQASVGMCAYVTA